MSNQRNLILLVMVLLEHPTYTKTRVIDGKEVPAVLLNGNHRQIERWRRQASLGRTWLKRPELLEQVQLSAEDVQLLEEFLSRNIPTYKKRFRE